MSPEHQARSPHASTSQDNGKDERRELDTLPGASEWLLHVQLYLAQTKEPVRPLGITRSDLSRSLVSEATQEKNVWYNANTAHDLY